MISEPQDDFWGGRIALGKTPGLHAWSAQITSKKRRLPGSPTRFHQNKD